MAYAQLNNICKDQIYVILEMRIAYIKTQYKEDFNSNITPISIDIKISR